jgi:hypothetical protein
VGDDLLTDVAAPKRADNLAQMLRAWNTDDPLLLLALHMLIDANAERWGWDALLLAQQPDLAAALLPSEAAAAPLLTCDNGIVIAGADLNPPHLSALAQRRRRLRRRRVTDTKWHARRPGKNLPIMK